MELRVSRFKALRIHAADRGTVARFDEIGVDELTPGEVVIRVAYSGINFKDALAVSGKGRIMRALPRVAGIDLAGHVESSADAAFKPGDAVLVCGGTIGEVLDGGLAGYARVPADIVVPLPAGLTPVEAMTLGTAGFTAGLAVRRMLENHQAPAQGPIAVTGPTGGVGSVAIQILKRCGFEVAAVTGKPAQSQAYLRALGADQIVDRNSVDFGSKPMEKALWGGAIDNLGGDTLAWLTRTVKPWGTIGSVGLAQAPTLNTTVMPFILRGVSLLGIHSVELPNAWRREVWDKLAGDWKPPLLSERILAGIVELEDVPAVADRLMAGAAQGRTVVRIGGG